MGYIKWNGKKFYPQKPKPYKPDINELMKPLSEKVGKGNIWGSQIMNVEKGESVPVSPTPTPSITPSPTITPTQTLTPTPTPSPLPPISSTFITNGTSSADQTTYTFTINNLTTDLYALVIHNEGGTFGRTISSITLGGENITIVDQEVLDPIGVAITYIRPSTAGNKTLSVTFSNPCINAAYGLWRIDNPTSDTPIQSQKTDGTNVDLSVTFTGLSADNVGILGNSRQSYLSTGTWTNATERYDVDTRPGFTDGMRALGADFITTASGNRTVTVSISGQAHALIGAVWN